MLTYYNAILHTLSEYTPNDTAAEKPEKSAAKGDIFPVQFKAKTVESLLTALNMALSKGNTLDAAKYTAPEMLANVGSGNRR